MGITETRVEIEKAKSALSTDTIKLCRLQEKLAHEEGQCGHVFSETVADHIYHKAYTIPGDKPGTMGVDYRGPCYVPARTENRWKRTCKKCGKVEYTQRTQKVPQPKW